MAFGFGVLRLSATEFWAMTPRELNAGVIGVYGKANAPPSAIKLSEMMAAFPD